MRLELKGPNTAAHADNFVWRRDERSRLIVISYFWRRRSHYFIVNAGSSLAMAARK